MVGIVLGRVVGAHAVVVLVLDQVAVAVGGPAARDPLRVLPAGRYLHRVIDVGTVVELIRDTVEVDVVQVAGVADAVRVAVELGWVGHARAVVAVVAQTIGARDAGSARPAVTGHQAHPAGCWPARACAVAVRLGRVVDQGAIVRSQGRSRDAITVQIVEAALAGLPVGVGVAQRIDVVHRQVLVRRGGHEQGAGVVELAGHRDGAAEQPR